MESDFFLYDENRKPFFADVGRRIVRYPVDEKIIVKPHRSFKGWVSTDRVPPIYLNSGLEPSERILTLLHEMHHLTLDRNGLSFLNIEEAIKIFPDCSERISALYSERKTKEMDAEEWYGLIRKGKAGEIEFMRKCELKDLRDALYEVILPRSIVPERNLDIRKAMIQMNNLAWDCLERFYTISAETIEDILKKDHPEKYLEIQNRVADAYSRYIQSFEAAAHIDPKK